LEGNGSSENNKMRKKIFPKLAMSSVSNYLLKEEIKNRKHEQRQ
jgi:hypothetical protein